MNLSFEWDIKKNIINIEKYGIDFNDIHNVFQNKMLVKNDKRLNYGEERFIGIGNLLGIEVVVVWTNMNSKIRIISARLANKNEREIYYDKINQN